ncbi:MAG: copper amine oxidase N-terminal domain-containing protein [Lachnospiraceae bacterium]|nr:copper amine oxidase N-terminal domain-containing protein [Lachnospiraceae bacterium]
MKNKIIGAVVGAFILAAPLSAYAASIPDADNNTTVTDTAENTTNQENAVNQETSTDRTDLTDNQDGLQPVTPEEPQSRYVENRGTIREITDEEGNRQVVLSKSGTEAEELILFNISDETLVYDISTQEVTEFSKLNKDSEIIVFSRSDAPVGTSLPPLMSSYAIFAVGPEETAKSVAVDFFDEKGLSAGNTLKLNVSQATKIFDLEGNTLTAEDIKNKNLIVFYDATTKSLPPQTSPSKIIVLNDDKVETPEENNISEIISALDENDIKEIDGVRYIALANVARKAGFDVEWKDESKTVSILKDKMTVYTITIGNKEYGYYKALRNLENAPRIIESRTFIESSFFESFNK